MKDHVLIATAYNNEARIYACSTKHLVEKARITHQTWPTSTAALGRLLTAAAMMSFFNKDDSTLTLQIKSDGLIKTITAQANILGELRGLIDNKEVYLKDEKNNKLAVGKAIGHGFLTLARNPGLKSSFTSSVKLISGEIAEDLTYYFAVSEQTFSTVGLGVLINTDNKVKQAGGFIVQLMPNATEKTISALEKTIKTISSVTDLYDSGLKTNDLITLLANNQEKILDKKDIVYRCGCSKNYYYNSLKKLDLITLKSLIQDDEKIEVVCHYCNEKYNYSKDEINKLILLKQKEQR